MLRRKCGDQTPANMGVRVRERRGGIAPYSGSNLETGSLVTGLNPQHLSPQKSWIGYWQASDPVTKATLPPSLKPVYINCCFPTSFPSFLLFQS